MPVQVAEIVAAARKQARFSVQVVWRSESGIG